MTLLTPIRGKLFSQVSLILALAFSIAWASNPLKLVAKVVVNEEELPELEAEPPAQESASNDDMHYLLHMFIQKLDGPNIAAETRLLIAYELATYMQLWGFSRGQPQQGRSSSAATIVMVRLRGQIESGRVSMSDLRALINDFDGLEVGGLTRKYPFMRFSLGTYLGMFGKNRAKTVAWVVWALLTLEGYETQRPSHPGNQPPTPPPPRSR